MSSYYDNLFGSTRPKTSGMTIFLMFLTIVLAVALSVVVSDSIFGLGLIRKKYPGETCVIKPDGTNTCLDGLTCCADGLCACNCASPQIQTSTPPPETSP